MDISVILPIHEMNDEIKKMLDNAINSILKQEKLEKLPKLVPVFPKTIKDEIVKYFKQFTGQIEVQLVENNGETSFQSQINLGVDQITTNYFSVLELDDEYNLKYFSNVLKHIKYYEDVDIFLSILVESDEKDNVVKLTNEPVWAKMVVGENGELGYLNQHALQQNTDYKISGAVIKKESFKKIGGLKTKIKLTFVYEFLLRALYKGLKIYTIPIVGYKHQYLRKGGLFDSYKNMSIIEKRFWFNVATKEANFLSDRDIDLSQLNPVEKK